MRILALYQLNSLLKMYDDNVGTFAWYSQEPELVTMLRKIVENGEEIDLQLTHSLIITFNKEAKKSKGIVAKIIEAFFNYLSEDQRNLYKLTEYKISLDQIEKIYDLGWHALEYIVNILLRADKKINKLELLNLILAQPSLESFYSRFNKLANFGAVNKVNLELILQYPHPSLPDALHTLDLNNLPLQQFIARSDNPLAYAEAAVKLHQANLLNYVEQVKNHSNPAELAEAIVVLETNNIKAADYLFLLKKTKNPNELVKTLLDLNCLKLLNQSQLKSIITMLNGSETYYYSYGHSVTSYLKYTNHCNKESYLMVMGHQDSIQMAAGMKTLYGAHLLDEYLNFIYKFKIPRQAAEIIVYLHKENILTQEIENELLKRAKNIHEIYSAIINLQSTSTTISSDEFLIIVRGEKPQEIAANIKLLDDLPSKSLLEYTDNPKALTDTIKNLKLLQCYEMTFTDLRTTLVSQSTERKNKQAEIARENRRLLFFANNEEVKTKPLPRRYSFG